jgi:hypothetical protein
MDRTVIGRSLAVGVVTLLVGTSAAVAQDYYHTHFQVANQDYPLPPGPCLVQGSVQPVVYDRSIWMVYTCVGGQVIARRFFHPTDAVNPDTTHLPAPRPADPVGTPTVTPIVSCDPTVMIGVTGLNECQWQARYPR